MERRNVPVGAEVGSVVNKKSFPSVLSLSSLICVVVPAPSIPSKTIKFCNVMLKSSIKHKKLIQYRGVVPTENDDMKSKVLKTAIGLILFLMIFAAALAALQPVYRRVNSTISAAEVKYLSLLTEKTDLSISYKSLSPSILAGIRIKGIEVKDALTGDVVLTAKKAVLSYDLKKLLGGNLGEAFTKLTVSNANLSLDLDTNWHFVDAINYRLLGNPVDEYHDELLTPDKQKTLTQVLYAFPFAVVLKNSNVNVKNTNIDPHVFVKNLRAKKTDDASSLSVSGRGTAIATVPLLKNDTVGFAFIVSGTFLPKLDDSSLMLSVTENNAASYTLHRGEFLARYNDQHLNILSTQRLLPYVVTADINLANADVDIEASMQDFNPFQLIKVPPLPDMAQQFVGSTVSGTFSLLYNVRKETLLWYTDGSVDFAKKLAPKGESVSFKVNGTNETVSIGSVVATGSLVSGNLSGSYNISLKQPSGKAELDYFTLPNGNIVSAQLFVDPVGDGFSCYIPELLLSDASFSQIQSLNAVQLDLAPVEESWDFELSFSDYTHLESDVPGSFNAAGTFVPGDFPWVEVSVAVDSFYLDSIARAAKAVLDGETQKTVNDLIPALEQYIMATELYVSSDLTSVTFNAPYMVVASTEDEDPLVAIASFDGNDESLSISSLQVAFAKQYLEASADIDLSLEQKSAFFTADLQFNRIPYSLTGSVSDGKWLSINGDYGLAVSTSLSAPLSGTASISSLPISIDPYLISLSLDSSFTYSRNFGFSMNVSRFEAEELSGTLSFMPSLALSGTLSDQSFIISNLSYADNASALSGDGFFVWSKNGNSIDAFTLQLGANSDSSREGVDLYVSLTNPYGSPLSAQSLQSDWFWDAQLDITSLLMSRFLPGQHNDDTLSAQAQLSGTLDNPFLSFTLKDVSVDFNGKALHAAGNALLEDGTLGISNFSASWNDIRLLNVAAGIELESFSGLAQATLDMEFMSKTLRAPLTITLQNQDEPYPENTPLLAMLALPDNFSLAVDSSKISGNLLSSSAPLHLELNRYKDDASEMWEFRTDDYFGASGYLFDNGQLALAVEESKPLHFILNGNITTESVLFDLSNFYLDMSQLSFLINSDLFSVYRGVIEGELFISGLATDPSMEGSFVLTGFDFNVPSYISDHFTTQKIQLSLFENTLNVPPTEFRIKDTALTARATLEFDRWSLSSMRAYLASVGDKGIPVDIRTDLARVKGRALVDLNLDFEDDMLEAFGNLEVKNTTISLMDSSDDLDDEDDDFYSNPLKKKAEREAKQAAKNSGEQKLPIDIAANIHFTVGEKVRLELNPLLRSLIAPGNGVDIVLDTSNNTWAVKGDVSLRGGEISYLNRNFYVKEGSVSLNETQAKMDPLITVRAETRERDTNGESVTITLEANRQYLSQFTPRLYANPAKSESELYQLLGQVALADSTSVSSLLLSTVDYGVQVAVVRKIEDALRDLLNFDIFSIRTSLLQNAVRSGLDISASSAAKRSSIGNYFDNSTVYIGKYFGTSLYADAMLHWTYDENKDMSGSETGGIVFQPEIGLEMEAPFANIRWNFAPDLENFADTVVSSTSVTLSWRFTF